MNVLLTNHHLVEFTGSEIFSFTIADFLKRNGHRVTVLSKYVDDRLRRHFGRIGVPVFQRVEDIGGERFDVAHVHHNVMAMEVRRRFPELPLVFLSHGVLPFLEQKPPVDVGIARYLAVSEEVRDNLARQGLDEERVEIFRNIVDPEKFRPRSPLPARPERALVLSNKLDPDTENTILGACERLGIAPAFAGMRFGVVHPDSLPEAMDRADIVFTLGRGVIEAMMCGRVPIVLDYQGGDGMVTPDDVDRLMRRNFSGRTDGRRFTVDELAAEIERYRASFGDSLREMALERFAADRRIHRLVDVYGEAASRGVPPLDARGRELVDAFLSAVDTTRYFANVEASRTRSLRSGDPGEAAARKIEFLVSERLARLESRPSGAGDPAAPSDAPGNAYDILIPVYNAYEHLARCIDSVLRNTPGNHSVYLLDDCSPDPRVLPLLRSYGKADARVRVVEAPKNMGFIRNVNRGYAMSRNDVVILNSDTEVTAGWLEKMDRCRRARPDVGMVCPLSNNATILSVPVMNEPNALPEGMDPEGFGRLLAEVSPRACPEIPTGVGFCMLVTRETLDAVGFFDTAYGLGYGEENDLCQRARAAGRKVVCCDDAYVHHYGEASFTGVDRIDERRAANERLLDRRWPNYRKDVYAFCCANPFRELQERIAAAVRERRGAALPSVLHVIHKFGTAGGTEIHTRNIIDGLSSRFHSTVMYPCSLPKAWIDLAAREETEYLRVLAVRKESADAQESFLGAYADISNEQVESVFAGCLKGGGHRIVHFQHLSDAGSLLLPLIAKRLGLKVVISLHDYYLLCPEYNLILPGLTRCEKIAADGGDAQCLYCLGAKRRYHGKGMPALLGDYLAERREILKKVFEAADVLVAPSEFVRRRFLKAYGEGIRARIVTVPHGMEAIPKVRRDRKKNVLNVAFLGNASDRKGVFVLLLAAQLLKKMKAKIRFEIFGQIESAPAEMADDLGIAMHGHYQRGELPRLLAKTDLVVIPSVWDETFCLTATESQMMGIPVLASDAGAIGERIVDGENGFLVPPNDARELAARLLALERNPASLEKAAANLRYRRFKSMEENVEDYARIYGRLLGDPAAPGLPEEQGTAQLLSEGEELFSRGEVAAAEILFRRVLEIDEGNVRALNDLGVVQWQCGDAVSALRTFQTALGFDPADPDALANLARAASGTGRFDLLEPALLDVLKRAQPANSDIALLADGCRRNA